MKHTQYHTTAEQDTVQEPRLSLMRIRAFEPSNMTSKDLDAVLRWIQHLEGEIERLKERNRKLELNLKRFGPGKNRTIKETEE